MSNKDSNRWIRTSLGYAGRNGYLIREVHKFRAYSYDGTISGTIYDLAADAKEDMDNFEGLEIHTELTGPESVSI